MNRRELKRIGEQLGLNCKGTGKPGPCKQTISSPPVTGRAKKVGSRVIHETMGKAVVTGVHHSSVDEMPTYEIRTAKPHEGTRDHVVTHYELK